MVTIRAVAGGGIAEGAYTSWAKKWLTTFPDGHYSYSDMAFYIDEVNEIFYLWWQDSSNDYRFGAYNLADFSAVFESPNGSNYLGAYPNLGAGNSSFYLGACDFFDGAISRSHQTYVLLCREDDTTLEVFRAGVKLWTRDIEIDTGTSPDEATIGTISLTGKYILIWALCTDKLLLYEGT